MRNVKNLKKSSKRWMRSQILLKTLILTLIACPTISLFAEYGKGCDPCMPICDQCDSCCEWQFHGDWLYWKVRRSDLDYAIPKTTQESFQANGRIECVGFDRDSGFRVGGYRNCNGNWNFGLRFTHYETIAKSSVHSEQNIFYPTRPHRAAQSFDLMVFGGNFAASQYELDLNILDFEAGYKYNLSYCKAFARPLVGIKFAFIDQKMVSDYEGDQFTDELKIQTSEKIDMDSYGVYLGLEGEWNIWCGFGIFGRLSGGFNFGNIDVRHVDIGTREMDTQLVDDVKGSVCLLVRNYEFSTGIQWELCDYLCADWMIQFGYEFHDWCGIIDFLNFTDISEFGKTTRGGSNLGYDGIFIRLNAKY